MKRKLENTLSLQHQIEPVLASFNQTLNLNTKQVVEKLEAIYDELSDENLVLGLLKLMQFYNLKSTDPNDLFNDCFAELKTVLLPIYINHVHFDNTNICTRLKEILKPQFPSIEMECEESSSLISYDSFDGIRLMLNHEMFRKDPRLLERLAKEENFSNCIVAFSLFYRAKILNLHYCEIILALDAFHSNNSEKLSLLLMYFIRSKVELKKEDIQEIAKAIESLINVIIHTPIYLGIRLGSDTLISQMAKNLSLLAHHKLLKSELLHYLYFIRTNEDKKNMKLLIAEKIPALIGLNRELSLNNPYVLHLFEACKPRFQMINLNEPNLSTRVKNQLAIVKKEYYQTLYLLMVLASSDIENPWAMLTKDILGVILSKGLHSSNQQNKTGFFKSEQLCLQKPSLTDLDSHPQIRG